MNGPSFDLVEYGGYLYVAQGSEVRVYDVSTAEKMSALTWKDSLATIPVGSAVYALEIKSGYLYIGSADRFVIASLKKPSAPSVSGSLDNPYAGSEIRDVVINGNTAYLTLRLEGVLVVDITDKTAPRIISLVTLSGSNQPWRATLSGSYLYVGSADDNRLSVLDVSNPVKPVITGSYSPGAHESNSVSSVAVKGDYAYVAEYHDGVRVIDVSNPAKPVEVSRLMGMDASDIKILGNYAYLSVRYQGFDIIDISNPKNIKIIGKATDVPAYEEGIYPTQDYTFIALESEGFGIYDTSTVTDPVTLSRINVIGGSDSLAIHDNFLYIGGHNDGIWIVDITNPAQPKEASFLENEGRNEDVRIQGNNLYIAGDWEGIDVADVSNPKNPRFIVKHFSENIDDVLPDGNYVYTDEGIADFSNMASPRYIARSPYFHGRMAKYGDKYLLVADSDGPHNGVNVIDISDKKDPVYITTFDRGSPYTDICVSGTTAVALTENSIVTIDMSKPSAPAELDRVSYPNAWTGYALIADNTMVYAVGYGENQIRVFDISNRDNITMIDSFKSSLQFEDEVFSVANTGNIVFAGQKMGVTIVSLGTITAAAKPKTAVSTTILMNVTDMQTERVNGSESAGPGNSIWDYILGILKAIFPH